MHTHVYLTDNVYAYLNRWRSRNPARVLSTSESTQLLTTGAKWAESRSPDSTTPFSISKAALTPTLLVF